MVWIGVRLVFMETKKSLKLKSGLHVLLWKEERWYVARCLEIEVASQGRTRKEALENVEEAVELYFEDEKIQLPPVYSNLELLPLPLRFQHV